MRGMNSIVRFSGRVAFSATSFELNSPLVQANLVMAFNKGFLDSI